MPLKRAVRFFPLVGLGYGPLVRSLIEEPGRYQYCADPAVRANASSAGARNTLTLFAMSFLHTVVNPDHFTKTGSGQT